MSKGSNFYKYIMKVGINWDFFGKVEYKFIIGIMKIVMFILSWILFLNLVGS